MIGNKENRTLWVVITEVLRVDTAMTAIFEVSGGVWIKVTHEDWDPIMLGQIENRGGNKKNTHLGWLWRKREKC